VRRLIQFAYDVFPYQIVDGPTWITNTRYDITAKAPDGFEMRQMRYMVQRLLGDRFGLRVRLERRAIPTYSLEWAERGRKLGRGIRPSSAKCDEPDARASGPAGQFTCQSMWGWDSGSIFIRRSPISSLVGPLSSQTGRPVIDKTELTGLYDADIKLPGLSPGPSQTDFGLDGSLFTAVREQLGFKLTPANDKVEVLVIEAVERPAPN
jgi:uncharacterized protein (TIGR03435 family)